MLINSCFHPNVVFIDEWPFGNGMSWLSIFMGLYTFLYLSVNLYGKSVDLGKAKIVENIQTGCDQIGESSRDHSVQMVVSLRQNVEERFECFEF